MRPTGREGSAELVKFGRLGADCKKVRSVRLALTRDPKQSIVERVERDPTCAATLPASAYAPIHSVNADMPTLTLCAKT